MFLTGVDATRPGSYAVERVKQLLETRLHSEPYKTTFTTWGQVEVFGDWATATEGLRTQRPLLVLEVAGIAEDPEGVIADGRRNLIEISIEVVTGPRCAPAESLLKDALKHILEGAEDQLDALALEESEFKAGQGRYENPARINPHTLSLAVHCAD
ncbi:hypothetical protein EON83_00080 [bacterium]|nr:MAG: hypothetical protein EON83_00080 [bacterium]